MVIPFLLWQKGLGRNMWYKVHRGSFGVVFFALKKEEKVKDLSFFPLDAFREDIMCEIAVAHLYLWGENQENQRKLN